MNLWPSYHKALLGGLENRIMLSTGQRQHASLNSVVGASTELLGGSGVVLKRSEMGRYIILKEMTHDIFISIYNVNDGSTVAVRLSRVPREADWKAIVSQISKWHEPNVELRVIGMQSGNAELLGAVDSLEKTIKGKLMEVDLFGKEKRHIVFDTKTGVAYNLLLENRLYRVGELGCTLSKEEFSKNTSELSFKNDAVNRT